jgi:hypothetical protein
MKHLSAVLLLVFAFTLIGQDGNYNNTRTDRATQSMANYYTKIHLGDISTLATANVITCSTKWPGYWLVSFGNPLKDSSLFVKYILTSGDTNWTWIAPASSTGKLGIVAKILTATCSDSLWGGFQKNN